MICSKVPSSIYFRANVLGHMRRDARYSSDDKHRLFAEVYRCGKTAPVLYDEFDEQLRDVKGQPWVKAKLNCQMDILYDPEENDSEEGRVLVCFCSHIGGHKFSGKSTPNLHVATLLHCLR